MCRRPASTPAGRGRGPWTVERADRTGAAPIIVGKFREARGEISGRQALHVEQNARKILNLADRVVILERGAIVHQAPSAALQHDPATLERYLGVSGAAGH